MKNTVKRSISVILSFVLCFSVIFGINFPVQSATVDYVYSGNYIKNWGIREEVATYLSQNAIAFYEDNNTSYAELTQLLGSSSESNVPSSALYLELNDLMESNHSYITSYDATRDKFQYTDCQNSGKTTTKISSFYSGKDIGPGWDSGKTWNREHTWPNSKGDMSGSGENDIMMLRPTSTNENGSRGNKAYGESSGYYDPNGESSGKYDLRGDVARIILYQYVRWECTQASDNKGNRYSIFGINGVIESKEILLEWMEADPVDTWELGRNDSVESITGTRNVFVDYPELAFDLFDEEIPDNYTTPSGYYSDGDKTDNNGNGNTGDDNTGDDATAPTYTVVDTPVADTAYKFGMVQENVSTTDVYYLAGGMNGYYMDTTTDATAAVDVYLEETDGGYYLYTTIDDVKTYINMVVSGTHVNGAYEEAAATVYTYDAESKTVVSTVNDTLYWFGTRNDRSYTTVGPCATSYNGFYCQFYAASAVDGGDDNTGNGSVEVTPGDVGDVNTDGKINNKDLGIFMQYLNDWDVQVNLEACDTNGDGSVNNKDYGLLMQYVNGWDVELGSGSESGSDDAPDSDSTTKTPAQIVEEAYALQSGETVVPTDPKAIVDAAFALEPSESLPYTVTLTGEILEINTPYDSTYKNITVTIEVTGTSGTKELKCYRMKGDGADALEVGDVITVTGIIKNYVHSSGDTEVEFEAGCTFVLA